MHDPAVDDVVGDRQQRADEDPVAFGAFRQPRVAIDRGGGELLGVEAALGAGRHDHRILDALRLHQPEDFGAEVVTPIRPAQAAACNRAGAQVDALDPRRIDPDLAPRHGGGQAGDQVAVELERQRLVRRGGKGVGAQAGGDQVAIGAQDAVIVDRRHGVEPVRDRRVRSLDVAGTGGVVRRGEARDQRPRQLRRAAQRVDHGGQAIRQACLPEVAEPGAQQHHRLRCEPDIDDQPVERVVLRRALQHRGDRAFEHRGIGLVVARIALDDEIMDEAVAVLAQPGRQFADDAEAEILQHRYRVRQGERAGELVDLELPIFARDDREDADRPRICVVQPREAQDVLRGLGGAADVAVIGRERLRPAQREARGARGRHLLGERRLDVRDPAADHAAQPLGERLGLGHAARSAQVDRVAEQRDDAVVEADRPVEHAAVRRLGQHLRDLDAARGGEVVAGQPGEGEQMPPQRRLHQHQRRPRPVGEAHRGQHHLFQRIGGEGDDEVMGKGGQRMRQSLTGMALGIEAELRLQRRQARPQHGDVARLGAERGAGPQAGVDRQADDLARLHHRHQHQIERHGAVDGRDQAGFQQQRRVIALFEPADRERAIRLGEHRRFVRVANDAERFARAAVAPPDLVAEQRELAVEEPLQQRGALALRQRGFVPRHRALQRGPVGDGGAHIGEHGGQILDQAAPVARIGAFQLDIDHRFGCAGAADVGQRPRCIACYANDGVDQAVDVEILRADRGGDRIDQEGHVVVDDGEAHTAAHVVRRDRLQPDRGLAGFTARGGLRDERRGGGPLGIAEAGQLPR